MMNVLYAILGTVVFLAMLVIGPIIEPILYPVISVEARSVTIEKDLMRFTVYGKKFRGCQLDAASIGWRYDHTLEPAGLRNTRGEIVSFPATINKDETFHIGPYFVEIPEKSRSYPNVRLGMTFYYNCHILYQIEHHLVIPLPDQAAHSTSRFLVQPRP